MRETAVQDVGDDLHVAVLMGTEALSGLDRVVVDHAQGPEADTIGVVVVRERERMPGIEPIGPGMEAIVGLENADHRLPRWNPCGRLPKRDVGCGTTRHDSKAGRYEALRYLPEMIKIQYCNS